MQDFDILNNEFIAMLERNIKRLLTMNSGVTLGFQLDRSLEPNRAHALSPLNVGVDTLGICGSQLP
jgi:hypothetical protein